MKAWESAEWFLKWLELARIQMAETATQESASTHPTSGTDRASSFGCAQLCGVEDHALAA